MTRFITSTAFAITLGTTALAEGHMAMFSDAPFDAAVNLYASDLIGARVYASDTDISDIETENLDPLDNWDDIGEINDIILTRDGAIQSVIIGVGGFLGIGEKDVAVDMASLRFVTVKDSPVSPQSRPDDYFIVIRADVAGITDAPAFARDM